MNKFSKAARLFVCFLSVAFPSRLLAQAHPPNSGPASAPESEATAVTHAAEGEDTPTKADHVRARAPSRAELAAREGRAFIAHVPRGSAPIEAIRLFVDVRGADLAGEIRVYYRPLDDPREPPRYVVVQRDNGGYSAQIPSQFVRSPGVAYWIVERMTDHSERAVFASSRDAAPLHVELTPVESRERRLLIENGGRRSQATLRGEWVDLGGFKVRPATPASTKRDRYYHLEAQYAYSFYRTIEEIEFALGHLRGDILDQALPMQRDKLGLDYGRAAITLALGSWFRIRSGVLLGVSTDGFEGGGELGLIVGDRRGTQLSLDGGYVSGLGGRVGTRLGWATIPRMPMGARVEITNFPTNDYLGVRMLFDLSYQITPAALVRVEGGYRGRTSLAGGPSLGMALRYGF